MYTLEEHRSIPDKMTGSLMALFRNTGNTFPYNCDRAPMNGYLPMNPSFCGWCLDGCTMGYALSAIAMTPGDRCGL